MRRIRTIMLLALAFAIASCSYVFTGYVNATIYDSAGHAGESVDFYAFTSKSARDDAISLIGSDERIGGYYYHAVVRLASASSLPGSSGSDDSIGTVSFPYMWDTGSPEWGEDGDRQVLYMLAISDDGRHAIDSEDGTVVFSASGSPASPVLSFN